MKWPVRHKNREVESSSTRHHTALPAGVGRFILVGRGHVQDLQQCQRTTYRRLVVDDTSKAVESKQQPDAQIRDGERVGSEGVSRDMGGPAPSPSPSRCPDVSSNHAPDTAGCCVCGLPDVSDTAEGVGQGCRKEEEVSVGECAWVGREQRNDPPPLGGCQDAKHQRSVWLCDGHVRASD